MPDLLDAPQTDAPAAPAPRERPVGVSPAELLAPPPPRPARVTVEMYHAMIEAGVFDGIEGRRIELLDEELVEMAAAYPPHAVSVDISADALKALFGPSWGVRIEKPVALPRSEPEPDLSVANRALKFWSSRHPGPSDLLMVVEISDSTLELDRTRKARIYAAAGISPYWIVNLPERVLEVRTDPHIPAEGPASYRTLRTYREDETVEFALDGRPFTLPVAELLPAEEGDRQSESRAEVG
ncbi:Uma2 family endonuclease [Alienimonas sp. DA493]|uniref:Uma2 family endonuclease n=1 Tax=Alienimonas sp. DA493 TaxID=3373605 RepID=UPI0037547817